MEHRESREFNPEEMAEMQKQRTLSDAELLQEGAEYKVDKQGRAALHPTAEQIDTIQEEKETGSMEKLDLVFGEDDFIFPVRVKIKEDRVTEVLDDIDVMGVVGFSKYTLKRARQPFYDAGIPISSTPSTAEDGQDFEGYLEIKKEDINKAIREGNLRIKRRPGDREQLVAESRV